MTTSHAAVTVTSVRRKKMKTDCVLYRREKEGDEDYYSIKEYCDGLTTTKCNKCRFYKSAKEWEIVHDKKLTYYVRK